MPGLEPHTIVALAATLRAVTTSVALFAESYEEPSGVRKISCDELRGQQWVEDCMSKPDQLFIESRLRKSTFEALIGYLRDNQLVIDGDSITVEEKVLTFLYICGQGASWRNTHYRCGRSMSTISVDFHEVLNALLYLYQAYVKSPAEDTPDAIKNDARRYPYFKDCVGALDGSHFKMWVPAREQKRYRNRHGVLSQNVLAVVDFDLNFLYILPGWEGSAHDGRVLRDATTKGFKAPPGKYFLADAGYVNSEMLLTPYRGTRYHLREIEAAGRKPETKEELFNYRHSSLRNAVERVFGVFKRRWRIFDRPHEFDIATQTKLVFALAGIHNFINSQYRVDEDFDQLALYEDEEGEQRRRDEENIANLRDISTDMSAFRDQLAQAMWDRYRGL